MYNGIGLTTPRGSGTNGHVQRNWAFLRPGKKENSNYRSEEDLKKLDYTLNRPPNKDILDHDRKRKIEVKCLEFEEILEKQGLSSNEIKAKVDSYRKKLMGQGKLDTPKDEFGRITVRDSHQIAEAQQVKNAKLREAFNISEYFVEGSSFDSDRRAKEDLAKSLALQRALDTQRDQVAAATAKEKESSKRYALARTPSMEQDASPGGVVGVADSDNTIKRKKKKKTRENSTSPDRKKDKKKKSKKHKKESKPKKSKKFRKRRGSESDSKSEHGKDSFDDDSETEIEVKKIRKKNKKDKKQRRNKKRELSSSDKSRSNSPLDNPIEYKKRETLKESKSPGYQFRSRSKEKSHKLKETQRHRYEASHDRLNRRNRSDRNKTKLLNNSHNEKHLSSRHSRSIEKNDLLRNDLRDSYQKRSSKTRYHSHEKDRENRMSRSRQRSKGEIAVERIKNLKRKHSEDFSKRIRENVDKRKQCSRTPGHQSVDNQRKVKKSRSRSASVKANLRKKSLTPPPRTSKTVESEKYNTNTFNNQQKLAILNFKEKKSVGNKSRSRTKSRSASNPASSTDTEISKSRTPSPKKKHRDLISNNIDTQKHTEEKRKSQSPIRTATLVKLGSTSRSKCLVLNENSRIDKPRSASKSKEWLEKREENKNLPSSTPPPFKVEKKVLSPRSSRNSSELSYSPARRNPERYRDIVEKPKNEKNDKSNIYDKDEEKNKHVKFSKQTEEQESERKEKGGRSERNQAKPVVRLQSQSDEDSDVTERNTEKLLDEFQESRREKELKELKMLEELKTGIAAKAKEKIKTIEKMAASTSTSLLSSNEEEPLVAALADSSLVDAIVSKVSTATVAAAESAARRSRSRSRRSRSRNRHDVKASCGGNNSIGGNVDLDGFRRRSTSHSRSSRSSTSSRSRSRSHSHGSSRSHSSKSSLSSNTSSRSSSSSSGSSRSGTRSPSIPRRRGSPSFLDRRRITSARKRPIPYHRKLSSDVSSCYCSSCCSRDSSTRSRSLSRDSRSPSKFF